MIVPLPPNGSSLARHWQTLFEVGIEPQELRGNVESIASQDAEAVFVKLRQWYGGAEGLSLVPPLWAKNAFVRHGIVCFEVRCCSLLYAA